MIFGTFPLAQAFGAVLAHCNRLPGRVLKKGMVLDEAAIAALREAGRTDIVAARLEPGDVAKNAAAEIVLSILAEFVAVRRGATLGGEGGLSSRFVLC